MKVLETFSTLVSIVSGTLTTISLIGVSKAASDTKVFTISETMLWKIIGLSGVLFLASLFFGRENIKKNISTIKTQLQFGGKNNRQNMK